MNVFFIGGETAFWQDVLIRFEELGINIHSALVHYYHENKGPRKFYNNFKGNIIDGLKLFNLKEISQLIPEDHYVLDRKTTEYFEPVERDFYTMTDRFSYFPVSFRERKRLFRQCLRFWLTYFSNNPVDVLLIPVTPHSISDFTCYHAAKFIGIPTIHLVHTTINEFAFIRHDYREKLKVPDNYLPGKSEAEIKEQIPQLLWQKAFNEVSNNIKFVLQRNDKLYKTKNLEGGEYKEVTSKEMHKAHRPFILFKPAFKAALAMNGIFSPMTRKLFKARDSFWFKKQQAAHDSVMKMVDLSQKYIYFAMHYQPERTSCPEAGIFEDQLLAIEILQAALPDGWKLYVKENPIQFNKKTNAFTGRHARDASDYQDILRLPNVEIINPKTPNRDVINNAQIIATLTGSVGWEALNMGKPCIVFANAWYEACQSIFNVDSVESAKKAIKQATTKTPENIRMDILKYLHFMRNRYFIAHPGDHETIGYATVDWDEMVESTAQNLKDEFSKVVKNKLKMQSSA